LGDVRPDLGGVIMDFGDVIPDLVFLDWSAEAMA
jgi:hypothetical protein